MKKVAYLLIIVFLLSFMSIYSAAFSFPSGVALPDSLDYPSGGRVTDYYQYYMIVQLLPYVESNGTWNYRLIATNNLPAFTDCFSNKSFDDFYITPLNSDITSTIHCIGSSSHKWEIIGASSTYHCKVIYSNFNLHSSFSNTDFIANSPYDVVNTPTPTPAGTRVVSFVRQDGTVVPYTDTIDFMPVQVNFTSNLDIDSYVLLSNSGLNGIGNIPLTQFNVHYGSDFHINFTNVLPSQNGQYCFKFFDSSGTEINQNEMDIAGFYEFTISGLFDGQTYSIAPAPSIFAYRVGTFRAVLNGKYLSTYDSDLNWIKETLLFRDTDLKVGLNTFEVVDDSDINIVLKTIKFYMKVSADGKIQPNDLQKNIDGTINSDMLPFDILNPSTWFNPVIRVFQQFSGKLTVISGLLTSFLSWMPGEWIALITFALSIGLLLRILGR